MVFVIGGRYQGKEAFVREMAAKGKIGFEHVPGSRVDGQTDSLEAAYDAALILHLECYIRSAMERGEDPALFVQRLIRENSGAVVTADEIGSGVVPVDAFEREYRETAGRMCQKLAASADSVYRVVCGIGVRIK